MIALQGVRKVGDCGETLSVDAGEPEGWSPDVETKEYHDDGYPVIVGKGGAWGTVRSSAGGEEDLLYEAADVLAAVVMRKCSGPSKLTSNDELPSQAVPPGCLGNEMR